MIEPLRPLCLGTGCPLAPHCLRYRSGMKLAGINPNYFSTPPFKIVDKIFSCAYFKNKSK